MPPPPAYLNENDRQFVVAEQQKNLGEWKIVNGQNTFVAAPPRPKKPSLWQRFFDRKPPSNQTTGQPGTGGKRKKRKTKKARRSHKKTLKSSK